MSAITPTAQSLKQVQSFLSLASDLFLAWDGIKTKHAHYSFNKMEVMHIKGNLIERRAYQLLVSSDMARAILWTISLAQPNTHTLPSACTSQCLNIVYLLSILLVIRNLFPRIHRSLYIYWGRYRIHNPILVIWATPPISWQKWEYSLSIVSTRAIVQITLDFDILMSIWFNLVPPTSQLWGA